MARRKVSEGVGLFVFGVTLLVIIAAGFPVAVWLEEPVVVVVAIVVAVGGGLALAYAVTRK